MLPNDLLMTYRFGLVLQMSKKQIMDELDKVNGIGNKKDVVKYMKHRATLQFLSDVFQPLLDIQEEGPIVLRVGRSDPPQYRKFIPYLAFFDVDAAEGYCICCCTPGVRKCRQCDQLLCDHIRCKRTS